MYVCWSPTPLPADCPPCLQCRPIAHCHCLIIHLACQCVVDLGCCKFWVCLDCVGYPFTNANVIFRTVDFRSRFVFAVLVGFIINTLARGGYSHPLRPASRLSTCLYLCLLVSPCLLPLDALTVTMRDCVEMVLRGELWGFGHLDRLHGVK